MRPFAADDRVHMRRFAEGELCEAPGGEASSCGSRRSREAGRAEIGETAFEHWSKL